MSLNFCKGCGRDPSYDHKHARYFCPWCELLKPITKEIKERENAEAYWNLNNKKAELPERKEDEQEN